MQPYQTANEEHIRQGEKPLRMAGEVASLAATGGTLYAGTKMATKVLPFLNKYIPEELAIKGLSKIDPRIGKFISMAKSAGHQFDEIKSFIQDTVEEPLKAQQNKSIIEQYSPELHKFVEEEIKNGESPISAGAKASRSKKFEKEINKLVHDHKIDWTSIVESVFGKGQKSAQQQPQMAQEAMQPPGSMPMAPPSAEGQAAMQPQGSMVPPTPQSMQQPGAPQGMQQGHPEGPGAQKLMMMIQKLQQSRGG